MNPTGEKANLSDVSHSFVYTSSTAEIILSLTEIIHFPQLLLRQAGTSFALFAVYASTGQMQIKTANTCIL